MINIALLGFGTVGSGVAEVLTDNEKIITAKLGEKVNVKYILDLRDFPDSPFADRVIHDFDTILNDPEISIVAEMMGGSHPAYDFTKACLEAGVPYAFVEQERWDRDPYACLKEAMALVEKLFSPTFTSHGRIPPTRV